jgi:hypothetical protein
MRFDLNRIMVTICWGCKVLSVSKIPETETYKNKNRKEAVYVAMQTASER